MAKPQPPDLTMEQREQLLASLSNLPEWFALKELLKPALAYKAIQFDDAQWAGRLAYQHGQSEFAVSVIRAVEKAGEKYRAKEVAG